MNDRAITANLWQCRHVQKVQTNCIKEITTIYHSCIYRSSSLAYSWKIIWAPQNKREKSNLAWKLVLAAFMLLMTSPTLPTTVANTKIPRRNIHPVKMYSYMWWQKKVIKFISNLISLWRRKSRKYHREDQTQKVPSRASDKWIHFNIIQYC